MKTISILNHKGGTGKTTSTANIGAGLARLNKKTLLIDIDPQANLTEDLGLINAKKSIYASFFYKIFNLIFDESIGLIL